jgi:hypothetical protein
VRSSIRFSSLPGRVKIRSVLGNKLATLPVFRPDLVNTRVNTVASSNPKGVASHSPRCCTRLPWVHAVYFPRGATPPGLARITCIVSQGSRVRQPWAVRRNPFGIAIPLEYHERKEVKYAL